MNTVVLQHKLEQRNGLPCSLDGAANHIIMIRKTVDAFVKKNISSKKLWFITIQQRQCQN